MRNGHHGRHGGSPWYGHRYRLLVRPAETQIPLSESGNNCAITAKGVEQASLLFNAVAKHVQAVLCHLLGNVEFLILPPLWEEHARREGRQSHQYEQPEDKPCASMSRTRM
jgi:hypothetical protein